MNERMPADPIVYGIKYHAEHEHGLRTTAELVADGTEFLAAEPPTVKAHIVRSFDQPVWQPGKGRHRRRRWWRP